MPLVRFGVSIENELLKKFDYFIKAKQYTNRSEAVRDLIRQELVQKQWQSGGQVVGAVTLIYDHHKRELVNKLMDIQHDFGSLIIAAQHVHLDHHHCLEIIAVKGEAQKVQRLADSLRAVKGVKHGALSMSTTGAGV